jgi:hypothetical protein
MKLKDGSNLIVSGAHSLRVLNAKNIVSLGVLQGKAYILSLDDGTELKAVPGSITPTDTMEEGKCMKVIAFKLGQVSPERTAMLEALRMLPLVAIYVDEQGNTKVAGDIDFPLVFSYTITGGLYECQLEGDNIAPNPYLAE